MPVNVACESYQVKKQYLTIAVLIFLLLILPLLLLIVRQRQEIRPKAAFGTVGLALVPPTLTKAVGEEFEVEVQITQGEPAATPTPTTGAGEPTPTPTPGAHQPTATPTPGTGGPTPTPTPGGHQLTPTPTPKPGEPTATPTPPSYGRTTPTPSPIKGQLTPTSGPGWICTGPPFYRCQIRSYNADFSTREECEAGCQRVQGAQATNYSISGTDITLSFDKDILEVTNVALAGTEFTDLVLTETKNDQGTVRFAAIAQKETDQLPQGSVIPLAQITFRGKASGTSAVAFTTQQIVGFNQQNEDVALDVDAGQKIEGSYTITGAGPTATPGGPTPTPGAGVPRINFAIKFRGMGEAKPDLKVRLRVVDENQIEEPRYDFEDIEVTADANKIYRPKAWVTLNGITAGPNYTLLVKGPKHLQKRMVQRVELFEGEDERNNFNWTQKDEESLDPGDLPPQDGVCNSIDASRILEILEHPESATPEDIEIADLNYDSVVNTNDYSLLLGTLESKYEDED